MEDVVTTSSAADVGAQSAEAGRGAIGLAALTTAASTAIRNDLACRPARTVTSPTQLLTHALAQGWGTAFAAGAGFAALALLVAAAVVRVRAGEINPAHAH
jgi:hypothetical protein